MKAAKLIREVAIEAKQQFVARETVIDAIECCILSGLHCCILGEPGTSKSALIEFFAKSLGLKYFKTQMNPDLLRDDLVGPIDPAKFVSGDWDRKWAGLATCHFAFVDEIGKGSGQTNNMLLGAMEERQLTAGDHVQQLPLFTLFSASNELFSGESQALWDRFVVRTKVESMDNVDDFQKMLVADIQPIDKPLDPDDLTATINMTKRMVSKAQLSKEVIDTCTELWQKLPTQYSPEECYVSDRRWRYTLRLAAGLALAEGCDQVKPQHLIVGKYTIWTEPDQIQKLNRWIETVVDKDSRDIIKYRVQLEDLQKRLMALASNDVNASAALHWDASKVLKSIDNKTGGLWLKLRNETQQFCNSLV